MSLRLNAPIPRPVPLTWPLRQEDIPPDATVAEVEASLAALKAFCAPADAVLAEALRIVAVGGAVGAMALTARDEERE